MMAEAKNEDVDASWIDVELASFPGLLGDEANVELDVEAKDEIEGPQKSSTPVKRKTQAKVVDEFEPLTVLVSKMAAQSVYSCKDTNQQGQHDDFYDSGIHSLPSIKSHDQLNLKFELKEAILNRNIEAIRQCISENSDMLNEQLEDESGHTALHLAAKLGHKDVVKVLLRLKASVNVTDSKGCTPLHLAASCGNYEVAKIIVASTDCTVDTVTKDGTPLLLDPASKGFSMICELLLENRADPLAETRGGVRPLDVASKNGHKDVVKVLLRFGVDPTKICRETSKTPLDEAIDHGHVEVMKLHMKAISEINKKNDELFKCKTAENIQELVKGGAKVDTKKADGSTPLITHSAAGNREVVKELVRLKANVDLQDIEGWSALMVASRNGYVEIVQTLVLAKADPALRTKDGKTAMKIAEQLGNKELLSALKRHTPPSGTGSDQICGLLEKYFKLKNEKGAEKQDQIFPGLVEKYLKLKNEKGAEKQEVSSDTDLQEEVSVKRGNLSPDDIATIARSLADCHCAETLLHLTEQLGFTKKEVFKKHLSKSMEDLLHELIFTWRTRNAENSVKALAKVLHKCGCYEEAVRLDPVVLEISTNAASPSSSSLTYRELSSIATHLDESTFKRLAQNLSSDPQLNPLEARNESRFETLVSLTRGESSGPNTREEMIRRLRESEYSSLAAALEAGNLK